MYINRKTFFLFAFMLFALGISAQTKPASAEERIKQGRDKLKKELSLTDAQAMEIEQLNLRFQNEITVLNKKKLDNKARGVQMKTLFAEREEGLKKILTQQQYAQYKTIVEQKHKELPKNAPKHPAIK